MRLNILPEPAFLELRPVLVARLARAGAGLPAGQFKALMEPGRAELFRKGVAEATAHEGTIWLVDAAGENLAPVFNTGPRADQFVGQFQQPLNAGLVSMVFASEQPFLENNVPQNPEQSKLLDALLAVETTAMIAVPFYFLEACRGVISCVQLRPQGGSADGPAGFRPPHLAGIQRTARLLSQLIEYELLSRVVGWKCG